MLRLDERLWVWDTGDYVAHVVWKGPELPGYNEGR